MDSIPQNDTPQKQCLACHEWKPASPEHFIRDHRNSDGFSNPCKICKKAGRRCHVEVKRCRRCHQLLPNTREFFHYARKKSGVLSPRCISCRAIQHLEEHPPRPKECLPEGQKRCTVCKAIYPATTKYFEPSKRIHSGLRPSCRQCRALDWKAYNDAHIERNKQYYRHYFKTEHGKMMSRVQSLNRRVREKAVEGTFTPQQIQEKLKAQKYTCYYCCIKFEKRDGQYVYHLDHTIPVSRPEAGPRHDVNYIVLTCPHCNLSKNDKLPHEFFEGGRLM